MKRWIHAATDTIVDNDKIQKGLQWDIDHHTFTVTKVYPNGKKCDIIEEWIAEDSGKECKNKGTYYIGETNEGVEYAYDPGHPDWKLNAKGAINYPFVDSAWYSDDPWYGAEEDDDDYTSSATAGDYSPSNPWDAPGMSIYDFI